MTGKYSSELERGKVLAEVGTPVEEDELGTIFTWVPRLAYLEERIEFLKGNSILEYEWITESCFNIEKYGASGLDIAFSGIWVGQKEYADLAEVENKNAQMNTQENVQGLIANEMVSTLNASDKTAVEKLFSKYDKSENETTLKNISTMSNRQTIKIVNTNNKIPLVGAHEILGDYIVIKTKYAENGLQCSFDKNEELLVGNRCAIDDRETNYTFYVVDNIGNIRKYKMSYGSGRPDLTGFNENATFYVTYNALGQEESYILIGDEPPANWYNYNISQWANIVVRENGCENYYVWIPRYMYKITDVENQRVDAKFVDLSNVWTDETGKEISLNNTEYKLPEAFSWEDPNNPNKKVQLAGFWASKYKLRDTTDKASFRIDAAITTSGRQIKISNIIATASEQNFTAYVRKNGKIVQTQALPLGIDYTFTVDSDGTYSVEILQHSTTSGVVAGIVKEIEVKQIDPPDVTGFRVDTTYIVTYNDDGTESRTLLSDVLEAGAVINEDKTLKTGKIDINKVAGWYDYADRKWANIVTKNEISDGSEVENYFVWIPRYEYVIGSGLERKTAVKLLRKDEMADEGYTMPESFTWDKGDGTKVQLAGFWASKYKLREK